MNDLVLVLDGVIEPGVVSAAADNNDVGFASTRKICRGGFKVVRVHVIAFNDGSDFHIHTFSGVSNGLCDIAPDGRGGNDIQGVGVIAAF